MRAPEPSGIGIRGGSPMRETLGVVAPDIGPLGPCASAVLGDADVTGCWARLVRHGVSQTARVPEYAQVRQDSSRRPGLLGDPNGT